MRTGRLPLQPQLLRAFAPDGAVTHEGAATTQEDQGGRRKGPYAGWGLYVKVETNEGLFLLSGAEDSVVGVGIVGAVVVAGLALKFLLKR